MRDALGTNMFFFFRVCSFAGKLSLRASSSSLERVSKRNMKIKTPRKNVRIDEMLDTFVLLK